MSSIRKILAIMLIGGIFSSAVMAGGTESGTTVSSTATLSFGDTEETAKTVNSNTESFVVDNKVDMTVTTLDVSAVQTAPQKTDVVLKFKVTNNGNSAQDYSLAALTSTTSLTMGSENLTDNFNADNLRIVVDDGDGVYDASKDTQTYIDELSPDDSAIVYIVADIPDNVANDNVAIYDLQAQVAKGGTQGTKGDDITSDDRDKVDNPLTVEIVFADGAGSVTGEVARDGKFSSADAYKIVIANMSITKVSVVISDPFNDTTNPKRIPGAVVRYCFTVENSGGADAAVANITDDIDETKYTIDTLDNNSIRIYDGADAFDCATAQNLTTNGNTGTVDTTTGAIKIVLNGVKQGKSKSAYFDLVLK